MGQTLHIVSWLLVSGVELYKHTLIFPFPLVSSIAAVAGGIVGAIVVILVILFIIFLVLFLR